MFCTTEKLVRALRLFSAIVAAALSIAIVTIITAKDEVSILI